MSRGLGSLTPEPTLSVRFPLLSTSLAPPTCSYLLALVDSYSVLPSCSAQVPCPSPLNQWKSRAHCVQCSVGTWPRFRWSEWPFPLCTSLSGPGLLGKNFVLTTDCLEKKGPSFCFLISLAITDSTNHCQGCQATLRRLSGGDAAGTRCLRSAAKPFGLVKGQRRGGQHSISI